MQTKDNKVKRILLGIIGFFIICTILKEGYKIFEKHQFQNQLAGSLEIKEPEEYKDIWQGTMSDINGMTKWDKYEMGLEVKEGSDTDRDGITDKEEIELYGSDPLKVSTAGDLYTDLYKIENGMDVMKYYEPAGKMQFAYNECSEVYLEANDPYDFNAVVTKTEEKNGYGQDKIYAQYEVYNYSGKIKIDLSEILHENSITMSDFSIYVTDGSSTKKCRFVTEGNVAALKQEFDSFLTYKISVIEKGVINGLGIKFSNVFEIPAIPMNEEDVTGEGLALGSPFLSVLFRTPIEVYYQDLGDETYNHILKEKVVDKSREIFESEPMHHPEKHIQPKSVVEIKVIYEFLKKMLPMCDLSKTGYEDHYLLKLIFSYCSYSEAIEWKEKTAAVPEESISGFNIYKDALPFENFKSDINKEGNCAGFSHLTAQVFNTKSYNSKGSYVKDGEDISWDLTTDYENATLMDKGLSDYKTESFVKEHSTGGKYIDGELTDGEKQFINMIGTACLQGNYYTNMMIEEHYGSYNSYVELDYSLIEKMKEHLEEGKILDVYMKMTDGTGHAVNIYDYETDSSDENIVWFRVYDSAFPESWTDEAKISENGFKLKTIRKKKLQGEGDTFSYEYFPLENVNYGTTSNRELIENPLLIVMDEEWNDINPKLIYEFSNDFMFHYVSNANATKDYNALCHYKDSYFYDPSCGANEKDGYNSSLATASLCFALSGFGSTTGGMEDYSNKYINVKEFLEYANFKNFDHNKHFEVKPTRDSIAVASASKKLKVQEDGEVKEYTLIAAAVRGGGYESEWASNFTLGKEGPHQGFSEARDQVIEYLQTYIQKNNISGPIKLWLVGYSRASATANLVAGAIDDGVSLGENVELTKENLYAYCMATPKGAMASDIEDESKYYNIKNILNTNDPVTKVAMEKFDFTQYGVVHFLPAESSEDNYDIAKSKMMSLYKKIDSYQDLQKKIYGDSWKNHKDDYSIEAFRMKKINLIEYLLEDEEFIVNADDVKNAKTMGIYLDELVNKLTEERIRTRKNYVYNYEKVIGDVMEILNSGEVDLDEVIEKIAPVFWKEFLNQMVKNEIIMAVTLQRVDPLPDFESETLHQIIKSAMEVALEAAEIDNFTKKQKNDLEDFCAKIVAPFAIWHLKYCATLFGNLGYIASAHYPEFYLAWLMSEDPLYTNEPFVNTGNGNYRVCVINCPIDVEVYDSEQKLVAAIKKDEPKEIKNSTIISSINEDGEKEVYLPVNETYTIKLLATDNGTMNFSVKEYSPSVGRNVLIQNYNNITIEKGESFTAIIPEFSAADLKNDDKASAVQYSLKESSDEVITSDEIMKNEAVNEAIYMVSVDVKEAGTGIVYGAGHRNKGSFAKVIAEPTEGYHFTGWYVNDVLISEDKEYRFSVTEDITVIAEFKEGAENMVETMNPQNVYVIIAAVLAVSAVTAGVIYYRKKKSKI